VLLIWVPTLIGRVSGLFIKRKVPSTTPSRYAPDLGAVAVDGRSLPERARKEAEFILPT
jgi:hypothetical protein